MHRNRLFLLCLIASSGLLLDAIMPAFADRYSARDFPTLGGINNDPNDTDNYRVSVKASKINNFGEITGYAFLPDGRTTHAVWQKSKTYDLGTLGGQNSYGRAINDSSVVAGFAQTPTGTFHAFVCSDPGGSHTLRDLGTLGGDTSGANGINNGNQLVGWSYLPGNGTYHACSWRSGTKTDLGTLGSGRYSLALDINDAGQVVGYSDTANGEVHAFITDGGKLRDLGTLTGGHYSVANAINANGTVVGEAQTADGAIHAFVWDSAQGMRDLGSLPGYSNSTALDINADGKVVGDAYQATDQQDTYYVEAFVTDTSMMGLRDLNDMFDRRSDWHHLSYSSGINNAGQITGDGYKITESQWKSYLLTPKTKLPVSVEVDEPSRTGLFSGQATIDDTLGTPPLRAILMPTGDLKIWLGISAITTSDGVKCVPSESSFVKRVLAQNRLIAQA